MDCFVAEPVIGPAERPDPLAPRNDDEIQLRIPAARSARVVKEPSAQKSEGAGKTGCPSHPQPRVQSVESTRVRHHRFAGTPRPSLRDGFAAYFELSLVTGLSCHHHPCDAKHHHELDASVGASGPHDFAVRKISALVRSAARVHRIPPRVRDDRETPLMWDETAEHMQVIWVRRESEYFCKQGWTGGPNQQTAAGKSLPMKSAGPTSAGPDDLGCGLMLRSID